ncbi:hypothetical protein BST81_08080 [Leptolyngbya sp. 'hensonii']|uniref:hypothetical protein n=1 Tax=Leptolyngbya sp. 'hensonii' TaxID=1922337 RepID=UPI00094F8F70|nr:hypothetical protein [Leptolyngbya sp. 'hensonii']OLP18866.1 hypothetical protein BST81_08080 [Leptolyngbya sp. 'hensonii']
MKYFFLSDGWIIGRVWETNGLWNENIWRRKPQIQKLNIAVIEQNEKLWLYQVEDQVLMLEVKPEAPDQVAQGSQTIGQVVLKRLISADQAIAKLSDAGSVLRG